MKIQTMNSSVKRKSPLKRLSSGKRKSIADNSKMPVALSRKSLLLQHSMSLHIPIDELSACGQLNCFLNLPEQVFSLTYLEVNDTHNPESLASLEEFKRGTWQVYLVGFLYNFNYQPAQARALERAINSGFKTKFNNSKIKMTYKTQVSRSEDLSPTENDSDALKVRVIGRTAGEEHLLYEGFLVSWCCPIKESQPLLPVLLSRGKSIYQSVVHSTISERFDVTINRLTLSEEELLHLSTYCLIMLDENDDHKSSFSYKTITGAIIQLDVEVKYLLKVWKRIHRGDSIDIDIDEIILFHEALHGYYEALFGIKLGNAQFQNIAVYGCFRLHINSQMWFKSTKVIHVALKYLNYLAIKRLKVKALNSCFDEAYVDCGDSSEICQ